MVFFYGFSFLTTALLNYGFQTMVNVIQTCTIVGESVIVGLVLYYLVPTLINKETLYHGPTDRTQPCHYSPYLTFLQFSSSLDP